MSAEQPLFRHTPFALERLRALGFEFCLGTDSLASNSSLSLFSEMRAVRAAHPDLPGREILEMATINGARALQQGDVLGRIAPEYFADLIALPFTGGAAEVYDEIIAWRESVDWLLACGKLQLP